MYYRVAYVQALYIGIQYTSTQGLTDRRLKLSESAIVYAVSYALYVG
jgi:hypothetical protein